VTRERVRSVVFEALGEIAPELDLAAVDPHADLREALDIDSFDYMRFLVRVSESLAVDIPERDASRLATLDGCISYLIAKTAAAADGAREEPASPG